MNNDIYLAYFVSYGVYDDNGSKVTDLIINNTKRPDYLTDSQGIVIHVINLKTNHMEIIRPTDDDDLKYLSPNFEGLSRIENIRDDIYTHDCQSTHKSCGFSYSQLIKYAAEEFRRNSCMQLEVKHPDGNMPRISELTFTNTLKLGNELWNCVVRQYNDGRDEICQRKVIIKKDTEKLLHDDMSKLFDKLLQDDMSKLFDLHMKEGTDLSENEENSGGSIQVYNSGFRHNLRSTGVYDESQIYLFSNHQLFPDYFHIHIINVKTGKQITHDMGNDACYSNDVYLSKNSNRACIIRDMIV
jgi:hypothetical protein